MCIELIVEGRWFVCGSTEMCKIYSSPEMDEKTCR